MKGRYAIRVIREVSYVETLDMVVVADDRDEAEEIAVAIGGGTDPHWPGIDNYSVVERQPLEFNVMEIEWPNDS